MPASVPGVKRRLQGQLAGDVGQNLGIDAKHLPAEALVEFAPDGILGQRADALKATSVELLTGRPPATP